MRATTGIFFNTFKQALEYAQKQEKIIKKQSGFYAIIMDDKGYLVVPRNKIFRKKYWNEKIKKEYDHYDSF